MGRSPCCDKVGLKKGPWTPEEDQKLLAYIEEHGHGCWRSLPSKAGLQRCGKSCRLRWTNYLRPDIKRGKFTPQEEQTIIQLHALLGNRWSAIASHLPRRTDNEIKNLWNTHLKKRLAKMGIDPATHKPTCDALSNRAAKASASLSHMAQWESARLEAEARLVREAKLVAASPPPSTSSSPPSYFDMLTWQGLPKRRPDLEEPTSTLTFSAANVGGDMEVGEEVDWKCFPKPMQLFSGAAENFPSFGSEASATWGGSAIGDSFTEMLLDSPEDAGGKAGYWNSIFGLMTSSSNSDSSSPDCDLL